MAKTPSSSATNNSNSADIAGPWAPAPLSGAARMCYEDEATQAQIASHIGVSRPTVSRLLSEARRQGIVKITVTEPAPQADVELRQRLERVLELKRRHFRPESVPQAAPRPDDPAGSPVSGHRPGLC